MSFYENFVVGLVECGNQLQKNKNDAAFLIQVHIDLEFNYVGFYKMCGVLCAGRSWRSFIEIHSSTSLLYIIYTMYCLLVLQPSEHFVIFGFNYSIIIALTYSNCIKSRYIYIIYLHFISRRCLHKLKCNNLICFDI